MKLRDEHLSRYSNKTKSAGWFKSGRLYFSAETLVLNYSFRPQLNPDLKSGFRPRLKLTSVLARVTVSCDLRRSLDEDNVPSDG